MSEGQTHSGFGAKTLRVSEIVTGGFNVPPSMHRLRNVIGLALGLWSGRKLMNIVTARNSDGGEMKKEEAPFALRWMHGIMQYNPYSDAPRDRWCKVIDNMVPAALGAVGAYAGSHSFFVENGTYDKIKITNLKMDKGEQISLPEAHQAASMRQAVPHRLMSAIGSLFGSSSGFNWLPVPLVNFGMALGASFSLGLGRGPGATLGRFGRWLCGSRHTPEAPEGIVNKLVGSITQELKHHHFDVEAAARGGVFEKLVPEMDAYLSKFFKDWAKSPEGKEQFAVIKNVIRGKTEDVVNDLKRMNLTPEQFAKRMSDSLRPFLSYHQNLASEFETRAGVKLGAPQAGQNGVLGKISNWFGAKSHVDRINGKLLNPEASYGR
jgi:hypothetical protein